MAHQGQKDFCISVKQNFAQFFSERLVLDVGSLDVNGNNQYLFDDCLYLGVDLLPGKNVDLAAPGHEIMLPDESIDIIISTESFEHDKFYALTLRNVVRMLKPGGLFLFTCASTGRPEHGTRRTTPQDAPLTQEFGEWGDYYKNLEEGDIRRVLDIDELFEKHAFSFNPLDKDLYFWGIKRGTLIDRHDYSFQIRQSDLRLALKAKERVVAELLKTIDELNRQIADQTRAVAVRNGATAHEGEGDGKRVEGKATPPLDSPLSRARVVSKPEFSTRELGRMVIAPAAPLAQPQPLLPGSEQFIDDWVAQFHQNGHGQSPYDVSCYFGTDVVVSGCGHIFVDDQLVISPEFMPDYWLDAISRSDAINVERALPVRRIQKKTIIFCGWGIDVYGHFLIEMLPRLMVARRALGETFADYSMLIENKAPTWFVKILTGFFNVPEAKLEFYDSDRERVSIEAAVLPTLASFNSWFHPFANELIQEVIGILGDRGGDLNVSRVCLSRALFSNPASMARRCSNEFRLAEIAVKEFGFTIVAPETFPWPAQIGLFRNAQVMVGEFGSGLHNAIFSGQGTRVGAVGIANLSQSAIGAVRGHQNAYLRAEKDAAGNFVVDESAFRAFLAQLVDTSLH